MSAALEQEAIKNLVRKFGQPSDREEGGQVLTASTSLQLHPLSHERGIYIARCTSTYHLRTKLLSIYAHAGLS